MTDTAQALPPRLRDVALLHSLILLHSVIGVIAKVVSGYDLMSAGFLGLYALELALFAVYAFFWQKVLKRFELSIAFANTGMYIVWTMIWARLFFGEQVAANHLAGAGLTILGILVLFRPWN